jgi:hypothetical protein
VSEPAVSLPADGERPAGELISFSTGRRKSTPEHFLTDSQKWALLDSCPRQLVPVLRVHIGYGSSGLVWAGRPGLAHAAGVPDRTFDRHRARLVDLGYLVLIRAGNRGHYAVYRIRTPGQRAAWLNACRIEDPDYRQRQLDDLDCRDRLPLEDGWS